MSPLAIPSTILVGYDVGGDLGASGARMKLYARVELTLPPGWHHEDTTLLYPLVVQWWVGHHILTIMHLL